MPTRLEKLIEKREALEQQIKEAQAKTRTAARKENTRRKTIAGALALSHMDEHPQSNFAKQLKALLNIGVKKDTDRALFDLEPLPETPEGEHTEGQENAA